MSKSLINEVREILKDSIEQFGDLTGRTGRSQLNPWELWAKGRQQTLRQLIAFAKEEKGE